MMAQEPHGAQSRGYLQSRLRIGAPVTLIPRTVDPYGRIVAEMIGEVNHSLAMGKERPAKA
jgi:endonuclease YncB( thermonuclease family)